MEPSDNRLADIKREIAELEALIEAAEQQRQAMLLRLEKLRESLEEIRSTKAQFH